MSDDVTTLEKLSSLLAAPAGVSIRSAEGRMWAWVTDLICSLTVHSGSTGAGDTMNVAIETVDPLGNEIQIMTFTQVLGNSTFPNVQVRTSQKSQSVQWFDRMQARVTRAGGTAAFNYTIVLQGS